MRSAAPREIAEPATPVVTLSRCRRRSTARFARRPADESVTKSVASPPATHWSISIGALAAIGPGAGRSIGLLRSHYWKGASLSSPRGLNGSLLKRHRGDPLDRV